MNVARKLFIRELKIAFHKPAAVLNPLFFFIVCASLFPLAVSPEFSTLAIIAPGVIWVSCMLAVLLSMHTFFDDDYASGILAQMVISPHPLPLLVLVKIVAHWFCIGAPVIALAPMLGFAFGLDANSIIVLMLTLSLATPSLSLIGAMGAGLVVGLKNSGILLALLVLPLYVPILIFGAGAVSSAQAGLESAAAFYFLAAILVFFLMLSPFATALALKISLE